MKICNFCGLDKLTASLKCHSLLSLDHKHEWKESLSDRDPIGVRLDLLDPTFLQGLGTIAHIGAEKYGERSYEEKRMLGSADPINHSLKHITSYMADESYDHEELGTDVKFHLLAAAFNLMMEWFYINKFGKD